MLWSCPKTNVTETTAEEWAENVAKFTPYIVVGALAAVGNVLIIWSVFKHKNLREKYLFIAALAGGDFSNGLGFCTGGIMRLTTVYWGTHKMLVSTFECMTRLYSILVIVPGLQLPILVTFSISVERLVAIAFPQKFYSWPVAKYSKITIATLYGYSFLSLGMAFVGSATQYGECIENICLAPKTAGRWYAAYHFLLTLSFSIVAVVIYVITIIVTKINGKRCSENQSESTALQRLKIQKKITKTMGIIVILTFIAVIVPNLGMMLGLLSLPIQFDWYDRVSTYFGLVLCANSGINVLVYILTNSELRGMLKRTVLCRSPNVVAPAAPVPQAGGRAGRGGRTRDGRVATRAGARAAK